MTIKILFYLFSFFMLASATAVISVRNPVRAALFLVLTFICSAVLWLLMQAEFLAIALVLVYVGAVMVLFLFVVMMLDINIARLKEGFIRYLPIGIGVALLLAGMLSWLLHHTDASDYQTVMKTLYPPAPRGMAYNNTAELGNLLYTVYVYPFEIAAVILLVAIIAAIALTLRHRPRTKYQNPDKQVAVQRKDRVRIVSMKPEEKK
ncbi:MAG: NADH-quinone oxidoreductase subunit J [Gammaproteobacteria bacterium]|nr:NADH-quinone oxidoreductase subunit J [Gammaproteobacteria bacterium]